MYFRRISVFVLVVLICTVAMSPTLGDAVKSFSTSVAQFAKELALPEPAPANDETEYEPRNRAEQVDEVAVRTGGTGGSGGFGAANQDESLVAGDAGASSPGGVGGALAAAAAKSAGGGGAAGGSGGGGGGGNNAGGAGGGAGAGASGGGGGGRAASGGGGIGPEPTDTEFWNPIAGPHTTEDIVNPVDVVVPGEFTNGIDIVGGPAPPSPNILIDYTDGPPAITTLPPDMTSDPPLGNDHVEEILAQLPLGPGGVGPGTILETVHQVVNNNPPFPLGPGGPPHNHPLSSDLDDPQGESTVLATPEPTTAAIWGGGLLCMAFGRRMLRHKRQAKES